MRLLHPGHDHVGRRPVKEKPTGDRAGDRPRDDRQCLPLRHLFAHRGRRADGEQQQASAERRWRMTEPMFDEYLIEPERYELTAGPAYHFDLTRRDMFKVLGGG